jgi:hypothetical protein
VSPHELGVEAVAKALREAPFAAGTRERVSFIKGLADAALKAVAACKPTPANPIARHRTIPRGLT